MNEADDTCDRLKFDCKGHERPFSRGLEMGFGMGYDGREGNGGGKAEG